MVIKIGSSSLVESGAVRKKWLQKFSSDVVDLMKKNHEIIIVSSGAIALGRSVLKPSNKVLSLEEKQAAAAIGQICLMSFYRDFFQKLGINVAQILLTGADCDNKERYNNCKNTIATLLKNRVIPIINENDSVVVDEIKIGDNDRLAARVAQMSEADAMILFSDIDGLYDKNPKTHKNAKFIAEVFAIDSKIEKMAEGATSAVGTGGMATKILAAKMLSGSKCDTIITSAEKAGSLSSLVSGEQRCTIFYGKNS